MVVVVVVVVVVKGIPDYKDSNKSALDKDSKSTSGHEKYASIFFGGPKKSGAGEEAAGSGGRSER